MRNFNIAGNFNARVFVFRDGIFQCDATPEYFECIAMDGLSQDRGDITKIECPSPYAYGEFQEVYSFSGELSRVTTTITTYMSSVSASDFLDLFKRGCAFDMHIHFGVCQNPSDFTAFDKAVILEDVQPTAWGSDPWIALTAGDKAIIQETLDISAARILELTNLTYTEASTAVTVDGGFVSTVVADTRSCGGVCDVRSDGCQVQFAITDDGFLYHTEDGGYNWSAQEVIDVTASPTSIPVDMMVVGDSIVILADDDQLFISDRSEYLLAPASATWDAVDISGSMSGNAVDSAYNVGVVVGDTGTIALVDVYGDIVLVEDGSLTVENLISVDVHQEGVVLVGGENGAIVYSLDDGETWNSPASSPTSSDVTSVLVKNNSAWLIGDADGSLWCTDDSGVNWTRVTYPSWASATTPVVDLQANSSHVVYMIQANRLLKSIDGGNSWVTEPSNSKKPFPTITLASIGTCWDNVNTVTLVGEASATGSIVIGNPLV
jgi:photosystem II stability/assembly factor-like uncharacterized protein